MKTAPLILSIESSCDDTAVALVSEFGEVLFESSLSQIETHNIYGGVVPEIASREHFQALDRLVQESLKVLKESNRSLKAVAVTAAPGLIGPLLVGATYAEGLALARGVPLRRIHHLRGHLASVLMGQVNGELSLSALAQKIFPACVLLVSGGHSLILKCDSRLRTQKWAETSDDAAGECFDKSAKLMGLSYPGGPAIEKLAQQLKDGSEKEKAQKICETLPRPRSEQGFSFSGLKTAIRLQLEAQPSYRQNPIFAWAIQEAIAQTLLKGLKRMLEEHGSVEHLHVCGGVSANLRIRGLLEDWAQKHRMGYFQAPLRYCADNAVMIAVAAWVQDSALDLKFVEARVSDPELVL